MFTLASASSRASSPSVPGLSWTSTTSTSRSSARPRPASSIAARARGASSSSNSRWMTPWPSPVNAARPRMFAPAAPVASPRRASWPGSSCRMTVKSLGTWALRFGRTLQRSAPRGQRRRGPVRSGAGAPRRAAALRKPALAQVIGELHLLGRRAALVRARRLHDARQPVEARLGQEHRAAVGPELALGDVGMAVAVGAERRLRVVEVQRPDPLDADELDALVEDRAERVGRADLEARREQGAGVQADPEALVASGGVDERRELVEGAPERAARAGGVLEMEGAAVALGQRLADDLPRARNRGLDAAGLRGPGVEHDAARAELVARLQRDDEGVARLAAHRAVGRRGVEEVHGMDEQRVDPAAALGLVVGGDLLVGVDRRPPGARALVEELDRATALLTAALDRVRRAAGGGDVGADQHAGAPAVSIRRWGVLSQGMRVRFAPSPTGALHIGGARTALYNWLLARHAGGTLVLRIEDTDRERSTPENVERILDALNWLELDWDEGPISQISRSDRHQEALQRLLDEGRAYRSTATGDDVQAWKAEHGADRGFRGEPEDDGAVRLRVPDEGETVVHDLIRGDTTFRHVHLDDPVIARADGTVLYNFAVAIDDLDAEISHVIRGEDHLSNTPKQLLVYEALGAEPPLFAHLPLLHGPDGKKLSKRHGAASVQDLRDAGYLPEAVRNYLALLGWGDTDDETILSTDELVKRFRIERVSRNPARFDEQKLRWLNGRYVRELGTDELTKRLEGYLGRDGDLRPAVAISEEKMQTLADFWPPAGFIFDGPADDPKAREKGLSDDGRTPLKAVRDPLPPVEPFTVVGIEPVLRELVEAREAKPRDVCQPIRVALAGTTVSPGIFETLEVLGRDESLRRIDAALST